MTTQTEKAKKIGMKQSNYSKWCKKIANDLESCVKGEARRVLNQEGYTVKRVKLKKKVNDGKIRGNKV